MSAPPQHAPPPFGPERLARLTAWYGKSGNADPSAPGDESKVLSPFRNASVTRPHHLQIPSIIQDLLDHQASPSQTADALASCILTSEGPNSAWSWLGGTLCRAAEYHSHPDLERLADVLVHLVNLPHHAPPPADIDDDGNPEGDTAFADLPEFGATLGEWMQGPRQYFCNMDVVSREAQLAAMEQWKNLNAFAAIITKLIRQGKLPKSVDVRWKAYVALSQALEHDVRDAEVDFNDIEYVHLRDYPLLWIPAAAEWTAIAGRDILDGMTKGQCGMDPRSLWVAAGGTKRSGAERWVFWRQRMRTLAEDDRLRPEVRAAVVRAARVMDEVAPLDDDGQQCADDHEEADGQ